MPNYSLVSELDFTATGVLPEKVEYEPINLLISAEVAALLDKGVSLLEGIKTQTETDGNGLTFVQTFKVGRSFPIIGTVGDTVTVQEVFKVVVTPS